MEEYKQLQLANNWHERCVLAATAEGINVCGSPEIGRHIYDLWVDGMNACEPEGFYLAGHIADIVDQYHVSTEQATKLLESIRLLIVQYDDFIVGHIACEESNETK
ncbi:hypothetical protein FD723_39975 (plasmid) [Nostoc sp. C052]|uniref:hypothetical protein n=1 Tax=Nostoc sp. C052 TaxID=2576902 RepID=UPI0015C38823|nr:hypothetical protein [Nostoc sp. C052]QLE46392.1 hypothetical protein FD723_39975 [Nostoc sp. C052]